jgi:signal transduction histidine kinase
VTGVSTSDGPRVLVVGASLEDRDETVAQLVTILVVAGPLALLVASLLGYAVATAALRPVESMRAEAAAISGSESDRRLSIPDARDEIRSLGETLNAMLDRLDHALQRERAFVSDAGHELRTPLAALLMELELALRQPRSADEMDHALRSAAEETDRLVQLAEDLLLVARVDQGRLPVRPSRVTVEDLFGEVARHFERRATGAGRRIEVVPTRGLEITVDPSGSVRRSGTSSTTLSGTAVVRFGRAGTSATWSSLLPTAAAACAHVGEASAANLNGRGADVWLSLPKRLNDGDVAGGSHAGVG